MLYFINNYLSTIIIIILYVIYCIELVSMVSLCNEQNSCLQQNNWHSNKFKTYKKNYEIKLIRSSMCNYSSL